MIIRDRDSRLARVKELLLAYCLVSLCGLPLVSLDVEAGTPSATYTMTFQSGGNLGITPEGNWVSDPIIVAPSVTISRLDVTIGLTHANPAELQIWLASPGGVWQQIPWAPWGGPRQTFTLNNFAGLNSAGNWALWLLDGVANGVTGKEDYCWVTIFYTLDSDIVTPAIGATISGNYVVSVRAQGAASVRIYVDDQWVSDAAYNAGTSRWDYTLATTAFPDGAHTITAVARDWQGNEIADGHPVTFDNWNIYVLFGNPPNGATISGTYTVTCSVPNYAVRGELFVEGDLVGVDTTISGGQYAISLDTLAFPDGGYSLRWIVYDPDGKSATALRHVAIDNYQISCSISYPASGSTVSGTITVNATVPSYARKGELYLDGTFVALATSVSGGMFSFKLDTRGYPDGPHSLSVIAYDPDGESAVGVSTVSFDNYAIFATIVSPGTGSPLSGSRTVWVNTADYAVRGELLVDGGLYATTTSLANVGALWYQTYILNTSDFHDGSHTVTAVSYDPYGERASHTLKYVFDNYDIYVTITHPGAGAVLSGNVTVNASVPSYTQKGELYVDDELSAVDTSVNSGQLQFTLSTSDYSDGMHRLRVVVYDPDGGIAVGIRSVTFDNYQISVTITSPVDGGIVSGTAMVTASVPSYAKSGELYVDGQLVATAGGLSGGAMSFSLNTKALSDGKHFLSVVALDPDGERGAHTISVIVDNYNIFCTLSSPTTGSVISGNVTCWVNAPDYATRCELYVDGQHIATCTTLTFVSGGRGWYQILLATKGFPDGTHLVSARAYDPDGNYAVDVRSPVFDNYNIYASIASPSEGARVSGNVTVAVSVPSYATKCELFVDGVLTATCATQALGQFRVSFSSLFFPDGKHVLTAVVYDPDGASAAASRGVLVDNYDISVTINNPLNGFTIARTYLVNATVPAYAVRGELYVDGSIYAIDIDLDALSRYQFSLDTTSYPDGKHRLTVVAYDPDGNFGAATVSGEFDNWNVYANFAPLSTPLSGNATVSVYVPPYARSGELRVDGILVSTDTTISSNRFDFSFDTRAFHDGTHILSATVYDPDGNYATASQSATVDNYQIYVNILYPAGGGVLRGTETVRASVPAYAVRGELYIDGGLHSTTTSRVSGEFRFVVDTKTLRDGPHAFTVVATDPDGGTASQTLTVNVDNYQISVSLLISPGGALLMGNQTLMAYAPSYATHGDFYIDGALVSVDYTLTQSGSLYYFSHIVDTATLKDGPHSLVVIAYDPEGNGASVQTTITIDNWRISVNITSPSTGSMKSGMVTVSATVPPYAKRGELYVDGLFYGQNSTISGGAYLFQLDTRSLIDGWHSVAVRAYDPDGESAYHSVSVLFDNTPPSLANASVIYPAGLGAVKKGGVVSLTVEAADKASGLAWVWCNLTNLGSVSVQMHDDGLHNDTRSMDGIFGSGGITVNATMGYHHAFITATDMAGNSATVTAKVAVDTHDPLITNSYCVYPAGQSAAKFGDSVRIVSRVVDTKMTVDVVLVIDTSGSMSGTPISDAKTAAKTFIGNLGEYDRAAIYSFNNPAGPGGNKPKLEVAFTSDKATLNSTIDALSADDWTPLYDTIYEAIQYAKTSPNMPVVIILTDGNDELAGGGHSTHTLQDCKNASIPVYTIGLDPQSPPYQKLNDTVLKEIAYSSDGGAYYHAPSSSQLKQIYEDLAMVVEKMEVGGISEVWCDASPIGGPSYMGMFDDGAHGDRAPNDGYYGSAWITVGSAATAVFNLTVTAQDVAGNRDNDVVYVLLDNTPPVISNIDVRYGPGKWWAGDGESISILATVNDPGSVGGLRSVEVDTSAIGGPSSVEMLDDGSGNDQTPGDGRYTSKGVLVATGRATGIYTFRVTARDNASNRASQSGNAYIDNGRPLVITIIQPQPGQFVEGLLTVRARATNAASVQTIELEIGPGSMRLNTHYNGLSGCFEASLDTSSIPDGSYSLSVSGQDIAGHPIDPPVPLTFNVDNHPPSLRIASPRSGDFVSGVVIINTSGTSDTFLSAVEYSVDGRDWVSTGVPWQTLEEEEGPHLIVVRAMDMAGHTVQQTLKVTVDNNNPVCRIVYPGERAVVSGKIVVAVKASDVVGIQRVLVSGAASGEADWNSQSGYFEFELDTRELTDGGYTLGAYAEDFSGRTAQAAPVMFYVDNHEPSLVVENPLDHGHVSGVVTVSAASYDGPFTSDLKVSYRVDEGGWVQMVHGELWSADWDTGLIRDGPHTLTIRSEDISGRVVQVTLVVTVDNHDPECQLISPLDGEYIEGRYVFQALAGDDVGLVSVTLNLTGIGDFQMSYNGLTGFFERSLITTKLPDGLYSASVIAVDRSGRETRAGPVEFGVDNNAPSLVLLRPREGEPITDMVTIEYALTEGRGEGEEVRVVYRIDTGPWTPADQSTSVSGLPDGPHTVTVKAEDAAGHLTEVSVTIFVDREGPRLHIIAPRSSLQTKGDVPVRLRVEDAVGVRSVRLLLDNSTSEELFLNAATGFYETELSLAGLPDGPHNLTVVVEDLASHTAEANTTVRLDTTGPEITLSSPSVRDRLTGKIEFRAMVSDSAGVSRVCIRLKSGDWREMRLDTDGHYTFTWDTGLNDDGSHTVEIMAVDALGNERIVPYGLSIQNRSPNFIADNFDWLLLLVLILGFAAVTIAALRRPGQALLYPAYPAGPAPPGAPPPAPGAERPQPAPATAPPPQPSIPSVPPPEQMPVPVPSRPVSKHGEAEVEELEILEMAEPPAPPLGPRVPPAPSKAPRKLFSFLRPAKPELVSPPTQGSGETGFVEVEEEGGVETLEMKEAWMTGESFPPAKEVPTQLPRATGGGAGWEEDFVEVPEEPELRRPENAPSEPRPAIPGGAALQVAPQTQPRPPVVAPPSKGITPLDSLLFSQLKVTRTEEERVRRGPPPGWYHPRPAEIPPPSPSPPPPAPKSDGVAVAPPEALKPVPPEARMSHRERQKMEAMMEDLLAKARKRR